MISVQGVPVAKKQVLKLRKLVFWLTQALNRHMLRISITCSFVVKQGKKLIFYLFSFATISRFPTTWAHLLSFDVIFNVVLFFQASACGLTSLAENSEARPSVKNALAIALQAKIVSVNVPYTQLGPVDKTL